MGHMWPRSNGMLDDMGAPHGGHVHCDLVMGVPGGMPGTAAQLVQAVAALPPGATWSATVELGRTSVPVIFAALAWPGATCGSGWKTRFRSPAAAR